MQTIPIEEAQNHLAEIIDRLTPGEEVVITRGSRPAAKLSGALGEEPRPTGPGPRNADDPRRG